MKKRDQNEPHDIAYVTDYIRKSLDNCVKNSTILKKSNAQVNAKTLSNDMINVLLDSLQNDREMYIKSLQNKIRKAQSGVNEYENALVSMKHEFHATYRKIATENYQLKNEYDKLISSLNNQEETSQRRDHTVKSVVVDKEINLDQVLDLTDKYQASQRQLQVELDEMKRLFADLQQGQKEMINKAVNVCQMKLVKAEKEAGKHKESLQYRVLNRIDSKIDSEQEEQEKLKLITKSVVDSIQAISPNNLQLKVTNEDIHKNVSKIEKYIDEALAQHARIAKLKVRDEIRDAFPELSQSHGDIQAAIEKLIQKNADEKESEYSILLKKRLEKEEALKVQLREALERIKQLQDSASSAFDDILQDDIGQEDWNISKRMLDEKMSILNKIRSDSSSFASLFDK